MRDVADLAHPGARIAKQLAYEQQALLQHEFGEGRASLLEQPLRLTRTHARARGDLRQAEIAAAKRSHHVGAHDVQTSRRLSTAARERRVLGIGAEQETDEIDHVLRGQALAYRIEMRGVMSRERVVPEKGFGDRTVAEHLRQLLLGAWIDVEERATRHADSGEAVLIGVADG